MKLFKSQLTQSTQNKTPIWILSALYIRIFRNRITHAQDRHLVLHHSDLGFQYHCFSEALGLELGGGQAPKIQTGAQVFSYKNTPDHKAARDDELHSFGPHDTPQPKQHICNQKTNILRDPLVFPFQLT